MTPEQFLNSILREFYGRIHVQAADNYDTVRFSHDGVDRSGAFQAQMHASYMSLFAQRYREFHATWMLLADDESRRLFARLILYRLLGHRHMRIKDDVGYSFDSRLYEAAEALAAGDSSLPISGMFGGLRHFRGLDFEGETLEIDGWPGGIVYTFLKRQYFLERGPIRIQPERGETVLDLGACLGDTALAFAARVGPQGRVYAFDPLPDHVEATRFNARQNSFQDRVVAVPKAVSDKSNEVAPIAARGANPGFRIAGQEGQLPLTSIDDFVAAEGVSRVDFIKMDIEGAELGALVGARATLVRDRPKLAISLYHRPDDFLTVPQYLAATLPGYDFHLDHYTVHAEETVLYGAPRRR